MVYYANHEMWLGLVFIRSVSRGIFFKLSINFSCVIGEIMPTQVAKISDNILTTMANIKNMFMISVISISIHKCHIFTEKVG